MYHAPSTVSDPRPTYYLAALSDLEARWHRRPQSENVYGKGCHTIRTETLFRVEHPHDW